MKLCLFVITIFLIQSCSLNDLNTYKSSQKEKLADEIMEKVAIKLKKEKNLNPCGSGGRTMYEIKMLSLSFNYYKPINVDEARELVIIAVNEFVDTINADERIRPYLFNYPFEPKNVEICIVIRNPNGSEREEGELCVARSIDGILKYSINDPEYIFRTIYKETYEEALKKISDVSEKTNQEQEVTQKSA